ncbi:MAG: sodium-dependent transporter [Blautia sp.]|uniref:sodium-dependent transporter n=1 Tax=Blautia sp. TaxID=1955243 RepID=UPI002A74E6B9|nr:sodium-dependent transporter [Blautia sp.]MDY3016880.1 sodium-dependent transporter [Blautia sp.]MED9881719.1 sodium-dependent transporter [Blautia sp.]
MEKKSGNFSGSLGFVLAAAGSAVGVGNIWRFPYLAAQDGGGLFILVYLVLVLTFGFTLLTTDIAIGRRTKKNALYAFGAISPKWNFLGKLTFLVPALIMTYYSVIGGWVTKYAVTYLSGKSSAAAEDSYFTDFITAPAAPIVFMLVFLAITAFVVYAGVDKGIERFSRLVMPGLLLMIICIAVFSLTLKHTDESGNVRTGLQGLAVYLIPNFEGLNFSKFLKILLDAMSQLFFSLSVSMGIMITYGSYVKKDVDLNKSIRQIEFFDTGVALLAGMMIIPAVYVFSGTEGMASGPSLMFVSLPKVFHAMGKAGIIVGLVFFIMVAFAALTSCVSIMETLVASCMTLFKTTRKKMSLIIGVISAAAAIVICLGYNVFYFELALPNGQTAQLLDVMDYISNSFLMPLISFLTCIFVGWVIKPKWIQEEMESSGHVFQRKKLYAFMIRYVAPVIMAVLFLQSTGLLK